MRFQLFQQYFKRFFKQLHQIFYQKLYYIQNFIQDILTYNYHLVSLQNSHLDIFVYIYVANKNLFLKLINTGYNAFFDRYESIYSRAKDSKILNTLPILRLYFFWNDYVFKVLYGKFILQIVRNIYNFYPDVDYKVIINK